MLRSDNPFNHHLTPCKTVAIFAAGLEQFSFESKPWTEFQRLGGTFENIGSNARAAKIEISHSHLDGLGAFYFFEQVYVAKTSTETLRLTEDFIQVKDAFVIRHTFTKKKSSQTQSEQTITQIFLKSLFEAFTFLNHESIGFVVNVLDSISDQNLWGNGIVIDTFKGENLHSLTQLPKKTWKRVISMRAIKTLNAMKNQHPVNQIDSLLISSVGNLDALPWAKPLDPSNFLIASTPVDAKVGNLIFWSRNGIQGLTVCAPAEHWLNKDWALVVGVWKGAL